MVILILEAMACSKITLQLAVLPRDICPAEINNATTRRFMCKEMDDFDIPYWRKTFESIPFPSRGFG